MEEELQRGRRNLENAHKLADDDVSHDNFVLLPYVYMLLFIIACVTHISSICLVDLFIFLQVIIIMDPRNNKKALERDPEQKEAAAETRVVTSVDLKQRKSSKVDWSPPYKGFVRTLYVTRPGKAEPSQCHFLDTAGFVTKRGVRGRFSSKVWIRVATIDRDVLILATGIDMYGKKEALALIVCDPHDGLIRLARLSAVDHVVDRPPICEKDAAYTSFHASYKRLWGVGNGISQVVRLPKSRKASARVQANRERSEQKSRLEATKLADEARALAAHIEEEARETAKRIIAEAREDAQETPKRSRKRKHAKKSAKKSNKNKKSKSSTGSHSSMKEPPPLCDTPLEAQLHAIQAQMQAMQNNLRPPAIHPYFPPIHPSFHHVQPGLDATGVQLALQLQTPLLNVMAQCVQNSAFRSPLAPTNNSFSSPSAIEYDSILSSYPKEHRIYGLRWVDFSRSTKVQFKEILELIDNFAHKRALERLYNSVEK